MIADIAAETLKRVRLVDARGVSIDGRAAAYADEASSQALGHVLKRLLYAELYIRPQADGSDEDAASILGELEAANAGRGRMEDGWVIEGILPDNSVAARRERITRHFFVGQFLTRTPDRNPRVGDAITAVFVPDSVDAETGMYYAFSTVSVDASEWQDVLRFYFHVTSSSAAEVLHVLTKRLSAFFIPYCMKCPLHRRGYKRADALVVYVPKQYYSIVRFLLTSERERWLRLLRPETPLFTKPLCAGLAFAEQPPGRESFGMTRCGTLARALLRAWNSKSASSADAISEVVASFTQEGVDPEKPYLNPGSIDIYAQS